MLYNNITVTQPFSLCTDYFSNQLYILQIIHDCSTFTCYGVLLQSGIYTLYQNLKLHLNSLTNSVLLKYFAFYSSKGELIQTDKTECCLMF